MITMMQFQVLQLEEEVKATLVPLITKLQEKEVKTHHFLLYPLKSLISLTVILTQS